MKASALCLGLIMHFEGFRSKPYRDGGSKWTIGYGHLIKKGEKFDEIEKEEAEGILRKDIDYAEDAVRNLVKVPLNQNQFDALTSFLFNYDPSRFKNSETLRLLNTGDYSAINRLRLYNGVFVPDSAQTGKTVKKILPGLVRRREAEIRLFHGDITDVGQIN